MDGEGKESIKAVHEEHLLKAKLARSVMKTDLGKAKGHPNFEALTFLLIYYKRQLSIYNEGIHPGSTDIPYCFTWKEGVAGRGAQEVGSCLVKYINLHLKNGVEHLVLWSDSCGGQNRNLKIVLMMKTILSSHPTLKTISFKYLESAGLKQRNYDTEVKSHAIYFKESHDTETAFKELDISKTVKGRNAVEVDFKYTTLYPDGKTNFNKEVRGHQIFNEYIPNEEQSFYEVGNTIHFEDDLEGFGPDIDFIVEEDE
nr:unnamed protein product [Callosobruchus chinensis]